jgi:N-methylhydantoinase A
VTDAAVVLGYLGPDATLGEDLELDADAAERALSDLADEAGLEDAVAAARGVYRVTNATTARAVRSVTVERGHDSRELALAAFGGAGPMFAAALSDRLGIERVVVPPASGVLSAFGLLAADESHDAVRTLRGELGSTDAATVDAAYDDLRERVLADCSAPGEATVERRADLRYAGQSHELTVDAPEPFDAAAVRERFDAAHERARGYRTDEPVELVAVRTRATIPTATPDVSHGASGDPRVGERRARFDDPRETPVLDRRRLPVDERVEGPAILVGGESTTVCPPAWTAAVRPDGALVLEVDG